MEKICCVQHCTQARKQPVWRVEYKNYGGTKKGCIMHTYTCKPCLMGF